MIQKQSQKEAKQTKRKQTKRKTYERCQTPFCTHFPALRRDLPRFSSPCSTRRSQITCQNLPSTKKTYDARPGAPSPRRGCESATHSPSPGLLASWRSLGFVASKQEKENFTRGQINHSATIWKNAYKCFMKVAL